MTTENNGSQAERNRPYVVLEEQSLAQAIEAAVTEAQIRIADSDLERLRQAIADRVVYLPRDKVPSRNAAHALTQVGKRCYQVGVTPPLVAISERMFKPRKVNIEAGDPRISLT